MKKLLSILTAFIMTASLSALIPVSADITDTGTCGANGDNVKWSYDSSTKTLTLSGTGATDNYGIMNPPYKHVGATTLIVENGITKLENGAFANFTSLTSVSLPGSLETIGRQCFLGCKGLKTIEIPNGVKTIVRSAFAQTGLTSVTIPNSVISIGDYAFEDCTSLKEITIPDSVTVIGSNSFENCTSLSKLTLGNSINKIDVEAFKNCTNIKEITIPDSVCMMSKTSFPQTTIVYYYSGGVLEKYFKDYCKLRGLKFEETFPNFKSIGKSNNLVVTTSTKPKNTKSEDEKNSIQASRKASRIAVKAKEAQKAMKQAKITKLKVKSKARKTINVTWKKVKKATGYQVQISTSKKFKKNIYDKHTSKKALKIKKATFKSGKKYYVRVRAYAAYTNIENKRVRVYSAWNKKLRKVKVK